MLARLAIVAGLVVGIAVAGVVLGGLVALAPDQPAPSVALPSGPAASASPSPPGTDDPSSPPSAAPSGSVAMVDGPFHVIDVREDEGAVAAFAAQLGATFPLGLDTDGKAQAAWDAIALPVHLWIDQAGIVRDGVLGGIGPDVMATGPKTILPGVDVTP
jgi:hypothetical protein